METTSNRDDLKEKVVRLVKDFIKSEGGINPNDVQALFGPPLLHSEVATALGQLPIRYDV